MARIHAIDLYFDRRGYEATPHYPYARFASDQPLDMFEALSWRSRRQKSGGFAVFTGAYGSTLTLDGRSGAVEADDEAAYTEKQRLATKQEATQARWCRKLGP